LFGERSSTAPDLAFARVDRHLLGPAALIWIVATTDVNSPPVAARNRGRLGELILILVVWIYVKVIGGSAPNGQDFTLKPFSRPPASASVRSRLPPSSLPLLGRIRRGGRAREETNNPRRNIPAAIATASR